MDINILLFMNGWWRLSIKVVGHRIGILLHGLYLLVYCIVCRDAPTHLWYPPSWNFWRGYESFSRVFVLGPQWCIPTVDWSKVWSLSCVFHMSFFWMERENQFIREMSYMAYQYVSTAIKKKIHDFCLCKCFNMGCFLSSFHWVWIFA